MKNSNKSDSVVANDVEPYAVAAIRQGYMDIINDVKNEYYDTALKNWQNNYEIGRLYAIEIKALGIDPPFWPYGGFPPQIAYIVKVIQDHYNTPVIPSTSTYLPKE